MFGSPRSCIYHPEYVEKSQHRCLYFTLVLGVHVQNHYVTFVATLNDQMVRGRFKQEN